ncbi:MAG: hypothetical protein NWE76_04010, partial [Candidatus Bathyarchaeota archaeon]|nr:hypothetical protein [Candidatus Bathyarchaeota archaeon]
MADDIDELLKMLEDPDIGEGVRATIHEALNNLAAGGFQKAYESNLPFLSRNSLSYFSEFVYDKRPYPHHQEIIDILEDESRTRELVVISPGAGKSSYVSNFFPTWWLPRNPEKAALLVSNTAAQAEKFCMSIRDTIANSPEFKKVFPECEKNESKGWTRQELFLANRKDRSRPDPNLFATGMGGPIQGRRAELIIIDDITTQEDASSEKIMTGQKLWLKEMLMTRLKPKGRMVGIMTRWSDKDLAPTLIDELGFRLTLMPAVGDEEGGAYVDYVLPGHQYRESADAELEYLRDQYLEQGHTAKIAINESTNKFCVRKYLHKTKERALWPEEHDLEALMMLKESNGSVRFNLVYQGNPTGLKGDI